MNKSSKCKKCKGTGFVQIAPNARGIKECPFCNGRGKLNKLKEESYNGKDNESTSK